MLQMFVLALSLYNTRNRGVFLLCKITNLLIYSLIILVCMIKIDLEYLKQEVLIVFAFIIYFAIKIGLFFIDRLCGVQKGKMQYHGMKAVYDERG